MSKHQPLSNAEMLNEIEHQIDTNPNSIYPTQARWLVFRIKELEEAIEKHRTILNRQMEIGEIDEELYSHIEGVS